jgi:hypothetical protein
MDDVKLLNTLIDIKQLLEKILKKIEEPVTIKGDRLKEMFRPIEKAEWLKINEKRQ